MSEVFQPLVLCGNGLRGGSSPERGSHIYEHSIKNQRKPGWAGAELEVRAHTTVIVVKSPRANLAFASHLEQGEEACPGDFTPISTFPSEESLGEAAFTEQA